MRSSGVGIPPTNISIMNVVPRNPADQVRFYALHVPVWGASPGSIGLDDAIIADLDARLAAAEAAYAEALALRTQAEAATLRYRNAVRQLHSKGSGAIATVKAFASMTDDVNVYAKAQIPPPSTSHAPRPAPGQPVVRSITVDSVGTLNLVWTAAHGDPVGASSGIYFEILRQRTGMGETAPALVGTTAELTFADPDIGPGENVYFIRARRGRRIGPASTAVSMTLPGAAHHADPHATAALPPAASGRSMSRLRSAA